MRLLRQGSVVRAAQAVIPVAAMLAIGVCALAPEPARAQFFNWGGGGFGDSGGWGNGREWGSIPPEEIYRSIAERGFRVIGPLRRNGFVFIADVIDRRGRRERLIIGAADGRIVQRFAVGTRRLPRDASIQQGDDLEQQMDSADRGESSLPVPPALIPNVGGQDRLFGDDNAAVEPLLPRPVPKVPRMPKPRLADRTPEMMPSEPDAPVSQPTRLKIRRSEPARLPSAYGPVVDKPTAPPSVVAGRTPEPANKPSVPPPVQAEAPSSAAAPASVPPSRLRDPLAIPRAQPKPAEAQAAVPRRMIVPGTVTGAPSADAGPGKPPTPAPSKIGDVPAAPLD